MGSVLTIISENVVVAGNATKGFSEPMENQPENNIGEHANPHLRDMGPDIEADDDDSTCVVCMCNVSRLVCVPCGHQCLCGSCSAQIVHGPPLGKKCPICRENLTAVIQTFPS